MTESIDFKVNTLGLSWISDNPRWRKAAIVFMRLASRCLFLHPKRVESETFEAEGVGP